ncbi:MAG: lipid deacylase LpxR family protein [Herminiimonas sp.]|nr:lipid deacylase LpxR family protein [Herminiimonas sp.]
MIQPGVRAMQKTIVAFFLAAACIQAGAAGFGELAEGFRTAVAQGQRSHLVDIDNDSLLLNRDDGFYTSGLRYTQQYALRDASRLTIYGWRIGQEQYTASDIKLPPASIPRLDHPYAGWLYGGVFKTTHLSDGSYRRFGLDIGCLGPCAGGEWTQKNLHRILDQPIPQGWSTQVKNEPGLVLYGDLAPLRWNPHAAVDITPALHGRFGNIFTDAGASLTVRAGQLNQLPGASTLHGFVRIDGRAIGYNATLQGGYFSNDNPRTVSPKRLVGEAEAGIQWIRGPFGVLASVVRRSNEISGLSNAAGAQNFARLQFTYTP